MAAYTSTQTGLWNDSATWGGGGYPSTDDTATINHEVVYNITSDSSPFYGDVTVNYSNGDGHLRHLTGTHMNMNGVLRVNGGIYEMVDNVTLAFTGDNSHDHGLYIDNDDHTTFLATGTTPVAETRMSTSGDAGDLYIPVEDASSFQTGDWISVFFRYADLKSREDFLNEVNYPSGVLQGDGVLNTGQYAGSVFTSNENRLHNEGCRNVSEGFIIHDIDSNNIYPRDLVGPEATITAVTPNTITVDNAKVFRETQSIIFGNGSTRTASTITSINYNRNKITLADALSDSNVVGKKVYLGGLKIHKYKRTVVRTVGNQVTSEAAANATTITLNNVGDYSVGDKFYVEHTVEEYTDWATTDTSWYEDIQIRHEITGINGNTLTFSPALPYKVYVGSFAYKANRPITIKGASDDPSDGTCKPYVYSVSNSSVRTQGLMTRYRRKMLMKDLEVLGVGNSSGTYQFYLNGGFNDGYWRYSTVIEGIVADGMGNNQFNYFRLDGGYYMTFTNIISANSYRNYYGGREGLSLVNSVALNGRRGAETAGTQNVSGKFAYIRATRSNQYFRIYHRSMGMALSAYQIYAENRYYNYCFTARNYIHQCHFKGEHSLIRDFTSDCYASYIKFDHIAESGSANSRYFYHAGSSRLGYYHSYGGTLYEMNYEIDNDVIFNGFMIQHNKQESAFEVNNSWGNYYYYPAGYMQVLMLRPNETVKIKVAVKLHENNPNVNWSDRPYLLYFLDGHQSGHRTTTRGVPFLNITGSDSMDHDFDFVGDVSKMGKNILFPDHNYGYAGSENYDNSNMVNSFSSRPQFDSKTEYVEQTLTITNEAAFTRCCTYGLFGVSTDASSYGFYFKDMVIARNHSQTFFSKLGDKFRRLLPAYITKGTSTTKQKKRIGGARL